MVLSRLCCMRVSVVLFSLASSRRLSNSHHSSSRSLTNLSDADSFGLTLHDDPGPPLQGCQANFWDTTCCCFVDAGILKQDRCECTDKVSSCQRKVRLSFQPQPSRKIQKLPGFPLEARWKTAKGYLKGYVPVEQEFCMAAPVEGPQVDSRERDFECTCSTSMGENVEMQCGSECNVDNCKRSNPDKTDWAPFIDGRGKCCLSSFTSAQEGCQQEVQPITESGAKEILSDALKHAALGERKAFLLSENLVDDMTKSFRTAKQKKVSTSRSGAEFFFSGNHGYILKSIHRPEYEVLYQITQPQNDANKISLLEHVKSNRKVSASMKDNCEMVWIRPMKQTTSSDGVAELVKKLETFGYPFNGQWIFNPVESADAQAPVYVRYNGEQYKAVWCEAASQYRIQRNVKEHILACENLENDELYKWLRDKEIHHFRSMNTMFNDVMHKDLRTNEVKKQGPANAADVLEVYSDFMQAFEVAPSTSGNEIVGHSVCRCSQRWFPSTLINNFVIAFEYGSSTWMVVKNSVSAISQDLKRHNFISNYKTEDMFDVKPFPIHSDQRELLFGMQFTKSRMDTWRHWNSVRKNLENDVRFMDGILDNPMVDYSLLVSAFYIKDERMVLDHVQLPNCVEERLASISTTVPYDTEDYGSDATGSILVCFSIIDMLMEFTYSKSAENLILFKKWSNWGEKVMLMFDCLGIPNKDGCDSYSQLRPNFRGLDIPFISTGFVKDVTDLIDSDGELKATDADKADHFYKCCCHAGHGTCRLADRAGKSGWSILGNPSGCGSLIGSGWHSYWREAGRCRIARSEADRIRNMSIGNDEIIKDFNL